MVAGIDGCPSGWVAVLWDGAHYEVRRIDTADIEQLTALFALAHWTCIDMPIGLAGTGCPYGHDPIGVPIESRLCDEEARRMLSELGGNSSSVFGVARREAAYAADYTSACAIQRALSGSAFSIQSWNITPKIRVIDRLFHEAPALSQRVFETHPELSFAVFAGGCQLGRKRTDEGRKQRLGVLAELLPDFSAAFAPELGRSLARWRRSQVAADDILDAAVLCAQAMQPGGPGVRILPGSGARTDACGLPVRIAIPMITKVSDFH